MRWVFLLILQKTTDCCHIEPVCEKPQYIVDDRMKVFCLECQAGPENIPLPGRSSPAQQRNVGVAAEVRHTVAYKDTVNLVLPDVSREACAVVAEVKDVEFGEIFQ